MIYQQVIDGEQGSLPRHFRHNHLKLLQVFVEILPRICPATPPSVSPCAPSARASWQARFWHSASHCPTGHGLLWQVIMGSTPVLFRILRVRGLSGRLMLRKFTNTPFYRLILLLAILFWEQEVGCSNPFIRNILRFSNYAWRTNYFNNLERFRAEPVIFCPFSICRDRRYSLKSTQLISQKSG